MQYQYDSYNRIQRMTYPDGEVVSYGYNRGGMLESVLGNKNGVSSDYIKEIRYNKYELKDTVTYGNGTGVRYMYDSILRLSHLRSACADGTMQDIVYTYDSVSNITGITNSAAMLPNGLGGAYSSSYEYDNLYRLANAEGSWQGLYNLSYHTGMGYCANGRVNKKNIAARRLRNGISDTVNYLYGYFYENPVQRNTLTRVVCFGSTGDYDLHYSWTPTGNMDTCDTEGAGIRRLCWDEQNRLQGVIDENYLSYYLYDAAGDRTYKLTGKVELQNISGEWRDFFKLYNTTLYASPYVVATDKGYTKHYYAESERIASRIGGGRLHDLDQPIVENTIIDEKKEHINKQATDVLGNCLDARWYDVSTDISKLYIWRDSVQPEKECYWYHPDHLGSSSWITYSDGKAVQHLHYLPWGEDFVDQRLNSFDGVRYTFSAKEKDTETGYSYFGARYYSSDLSIWLSVDPMSDKYPSTSPYAYCRNNPIILVDPNGSKDRPFNRHTDSPTTKIKGTSTPIRKLSCGTINIKFDKISILTSYNCHSYAWHNSKGDKNPQKGDIPHALDGSELPLWDNNPADDIKEQNARQLDPSEDNIPGDIVIYYTDKNSNNQYDDGEFITHSAVVKTVDEEGYTTEVIAKDGDKCLVVGHPDAPGYYKKDKDNNPTKRAYFRIPTNEERKTTNEN